MSTLPKLENKYVKIKVGEQEIEIKAWRTKDEKAYLIYKEQADLDEKAVFDILIKPCIKDVEKYNFTSNEEIYIMTKIREISLGTGITLNFTCPHCEKFQDQEISLNDIIKYTPANYHNVKIQDYEFVFTKNNSPKFKERIAAAESIVEAEFVSLVMSISEIKIDKKTYDTFTFTELYDFINDLSTDIFDELYAEYTEMVDSLTMDYEVKCLFCDKVNKGSLERIPGFLWD
jgi:hypothetical protein